MKPIKQLKILFSIVLTAGFLVLSGSADAQSVTVGTVEELYAAVNNPANIGITIDLAPGVYMLSATGPNNVLRPNRGRLELQENMGLQGIVGDREAVVIDAANLPTTSFNSGTTDSSDRSYSNRTRLQFARMANSQKCGKCCREHRDRTDLTSTARIRIAI